MKEHAWKWCPTCRNLVVICGACGNNACNGTYGTVDGEKCTACPSAYELQASQRGGRWWLGPALVALVIFGHVHRKIRLALIRFDNWWWGL